MRNTQLGDTGLTSSVLGFGCAPMLGRAGRRESLRALGAACDAGITFYDTARAYGYGQGEALLGEFLRGRRQQVIVATKFGILPAPQSALKTLAKPLVRSALAIAPGLRGAVRRRTANELTAGAFTIEALEKSLHESLCSLRTDYVDLLLMHAAPASVLQQEDLLLALQNLVSQGKVRVAGISAEPDVVGIALRQKPRPLRAVQFPCNIFDFSAMEVLGSAGPAGWAAVANHPFGGVTRVQQSRAALSRIARSPDTPAPLREKLGEVDDTVLADVVLNLILQSTGIHVVVPAMIRPVHLRTNVSVIDRSRFTADEIAWLRGQLQKAVSAAA